MPAYEREFFRQGDVVWTLFHDTDGNGLQVIRYRTSATQRTKISQSLAHFLVEGTGPEAAALGKVLLGLVPAVKEHEVEPDAHRT